MNIGPVIRRLRQAQNLTLEDLAERAEISASHVSLIERSKREPSFDNLTAITQSLGLPLSVFILLCVEENDASNTPVVRKLKRLVKSTLSRDAKFSSVI